MLKIAVNAMRDPKEYKLIKEVGYDAVDYNGLCTEPEAGLFALSDEKFERCFFATEKQLKMPDLKFVRFTVFGRMMTPSLKNGKASFWL